MSFVHKTDNIDMVYESMLSEMKDMTGTKCKNCGKGKYKETSIHDDMDGMLHCPKCGHGITRHQK